LLDKVRAMLIDADLPQSYWYDALRYAAHIHNVTPTRALVDETPEEAWSGNKPDISNLRTFGSRAFVHIPDSHRDKLSSRSLVCTFLGLARQRKAYRLVHRQTRRFIESRDVIFDEGGAAPRFERIIIENNDTEGGEPNSQATLTAPDPLPQPSQIANAPAPTVVAARPKQCPTACPGRRPSIFSHVLQVPTQHHRACQRRPCRPNQRPKDIQRGHGATRRC
jgi:hypothetical protein